MQMQEENIRDVIHQDSRLRSIKHDMNKHFVALSGYADNGDIEGIKEYIDDMYEESQNPIYSNIYISVEINFSKNSYWR